MRLIALMPAMALTLGLAACVGSDGHCVSLPGGGHYCLRDGPSPEFSAEQDATVSYGDKPFHVIVRIQSDREGLRFAALTPLGQTLAQVSWENHMLLAELSPALEGRLNGALFLTLIQVATSPAEQVRAGLSERLVLIEKDGQRIINDGQRDVLVVSWEGRTLPYERLHFEAPTAGLIIEARTLKEAEPQ